MTDLEKLIHEIENTGKASIEYAQKITAEAIKKNRVGIDDDEEGEELSENLRLEIFKLFDLVMQSEQEGDVDDYHNYAVELARSHAYDQACKILRKGLERSPKNTDLLADFIKYAPDSSLADRFELCEVYYQKLLDIPTCRWKWRAYFFSVDYLLKLLDRDGYDLIETKNSALKIAKSYQKISPKDERSYLSECRIRDAFGEIKQKRAVLERAVVKSDIRIPRCALELAKLEIDDKNYIKALEYLNRARKDSPDVNDNYDIGYLSVCELLTKISVYLNRTSELPNGESVSADSKKLIEEIYIKYREALKIKNREDKVSDVKQYIDLIEIESGIPFIEDME